MLRDPHNKSLDFLSPFTKRRCSRYIPQGFPFTVAMVISLGRLGVPINTTAFLCTDVKAEEEGVKIQRYVD